MAPEGDEVAGMRFAVLRDVVEDARRKSRMLALEVAGAVAGDPLAQDEIGGARGGADRIELHEAQARERLGDTRAGPQRVRHGLRTQRA